MLYQDDQKCDVFKIPKRMVKVYQGIIGEKFIRNGHGVLVAHLIDKDMVIELSIKVKNGKAAGPSGVVSEMVKASGEAGVDMIKDLGN